MTRMASAAAFGARITHATALCEDRGAFDTGLCRCYDSDSAMTESLDIGRSKLVAEAEPDRVRLLEPFTRVEMNA
jgi:hypothetical protein